MKRLYVLVFICLMLAFMLCVNNIKLQVLNSIVYDITQVEIACENVSNGQMVGDYIIKDIDNLNLKFNRCKYISFKISKKDFKLFIVLLQIHIVKKYYVFDNIVYDCKFDNIYNSDILTLQIAVGKDVKVGIPTIFEGF